MAQFQAQVPDPLADDLPSLLAASGMTTPAVGVLLQVFIGQSIFKRTAMQVESYHISSSETVLGQIRQEQFVDDAIPFDADPAFRFSSRMGRDDDADSLARFAQTLVRTVVERAADPTFRMCQVLVRRQVQAGLDLRSIQ